MRADVAATLAARVESMCMQAPPCPYGMSICTRACMCQWNASQERNAPLAWRTRAVNRQHESACLRVDCVVRAHVRASDRIGTVVPSTEESGHRRTACRGGRVCSLGGRGSVRVRTRTNELARDTGRSESGPVRVSRNSDTVYSSV